MEKLVVTRRKGGSFESRSLQGCPLQPRHASQGKESQWNGVGVPLERGSKRKAAPAQRCNRYNERIPHRSGSEQGGRSATMPAQRKQTVLEPKGDYVSGTHQPLPQPRTFTFIEIGSQSKQVVHQELDRTELARPSCRRHEDHADSRMVGQDPAPGWNQAEDQECTVGHLLAWGPLGIGRTQSSLRPRREPRPSRCFNRRSSKQQNLNPACGSCSRCRSSNARAVAATRGDDGARRCSHGSPRIRIDCIEVEERRVGDRDPSVGICIGRRRIEGDQEQEQSVATGRVRSTSASSLARKHSLSIRRGLDFCQSALSWQDSIHLSDSLPSSHPSSNRESLWNQEQQGTTDRMAHPSPIAGDFTHLKRGECESRAITASSHDPKNYAGTLRTSSFGGSAASPQEGRGDGPAIGVSTEIKSTGIYRDSVETRVSLALGVRGCLKSAPPESAKCFEILVSADGLEPSTHALKGHCSAS
jgi:hypothetical protein